MITNLSTISVKQLKRAVALRERIEKLQNKLADALGDAETLSGSTPTGRRGGRRKMSAAARARIGDAQRARWARQKQGNGATATKGRRKMSAAARAKIAAAARARWAKAKAE